MEIGDFLMKILVNDGKEELSILEVAGMKSVVSKTNQEFCVEVSNNSTETVLMILYIDGNNVDGNVSTLVPPKTASMWKGWRQNMNEVTVFKFDDPKKPTASTLASTNDRDVGLISAVVYRAKKIDNVITKGDDYMVSTKISTEVSMEHNKKHSVIVGGDKTILNKTFWSKEAYEKEELIACLEVRYNYLKFQPLTVGAVEDSDTE